MNKSSINIFFIFSLFILLSSNIDAQRKHTVTINNDTLILLTDTSFSIPKTIHLSTSQLDSIFSHMDNKMQTGINKLSKEIDSLERDLQNKHLNIWEEPFWKDFSREMEDLFKTFEIDIKRSSIKTDSCKTEQPSEERQPAKANIQGPRLHHYLGPKLETVELTDLPTLKKAGFKADHLSQNTFEPQHLSLDYSYRSQSNEDIVDLTIFLKDERLNKTEVYIINNAGKIILHKKITLKNDEEYQINIGLKQNEHPYFLILKDKKSYHTRKIKL